MNFFPSQSACLKASPILKGVVVPKFVGLIISGDPFLIYGFNISDYIDDEIVEFS